jgi:multidrug efflux pump subunit AcrA (membrane-fusion protein)
VAGVIRSVYVAPAQSVAAGALLFEIAQLDRMWVRVPVYVGEIGELASDRPVAVALLGNQLSTLRARPVQAPPSANAAAASADLFYELTSTTAGLRPGERVSVAVPLRSGTSEQLVVPWSAILHDAQGGTWVYEQIKPLVYTRRRVDLSHVQGENAILARGPAPGTLIVVEGAVELFGTEFGAGH